tara:strand:- start:198437 stop:199033 length:597 start_codon:yes stop_codon:yes gene_type:complete
MRTKLVTITLILNALFSVNAQTDTINSNTSIVGVKGGYNLSAISFDGEGETGQRHSFHVGFYSESFISKALSIQPELMYSQQGYEIKNSNGTFTQKLNYINVPLMFKGYLAKTFFIEAGPQIGLAISHKEEFDSGFDLFDTSQEFEPNNFDWGVNFGIGFKTENGVTFSTRYHFGLGDVYDDGKPSNRVWQFSMGFDF